MVMTVFLAFRLWDVVFNQGQKFKLSPKDKREPQSYRGVCQEINRTWVYIFGTIRESSVHVGTQCVQK